MLEISLPFSQILINPLTLFLVGIGGGIVSNLLRIGGGVFVTPTLVMIGIPPIVAFPSQLSNAIGTSLMGFLFHLKRYEVDFAMAWYLFIGGVIGAFIEVSLYNFLLAHDELSQPLNIIYFIILLVIGLIMLFVHIKLLFVSPKATTTVTMKSWMIHLPLHRIFMRARVELSIVLLLVIGVCTGLLAGLLGGGVSMLIMPVVSYLIGRSSPVVGGTARLASFLIAIVVSLIQAWHFAVADWLIVLLLVTGGALGAYWGRKITHRFSQGFLGIIGAFALLFLAFQFLYGLFVPAKVLAPTLKLDFSSHAHLSSALLHAEGMAKALLEFAISHPVYYTTIGIMGIIVISLILNTVIEKFQKKKTELWYNIRY